MSEMHLLHNCKEKVSSRRDWRVIELRQREFQQVKAIENAA